MCVGERERESVCVYKSYWSIQSYQSTCKWKKKKKEEEEEKKIIVNNAF